ncbi:Nod factor export ATP-binding protein I [Pyrenophora tritici-repentis]|uniref:Nod factor export ATP-binding protein I n=1 Tax=Pyrenophora tritici-repentis TaxID=45151 RepID=A0A922NN27_9PLEO|nr:Nod factor export ATP-binding protein I [Pyrenophora tritici-repentis]KAI1672334.1 Nod factor export ATP-binding protein I [Pyrenophora tritici-repentis]KAI1676046.1 Nod factor export ATP-binding protein I [Pyrenophora tritici-repentis]KAI1686358.1 Nod factor export ATP-binding protein I [Pyrenophora tritici-repentis]
MAGAIVRQTWILTKKTLLVVFVRQWFFTSVRAFWAPIIFMFFITYAKNFFVPPSEYGIGNPSPIRSFSNALNAAEGGRDKIVFVNNGYTGGEIDQVIGQLSNQVRDAGLQAITIERDVDLLTTCESSLRGASSCFGAAVFHSSPNQGQGQTWNYTLRSDGALGETIYVGQKDNDVQIYVLPFQRAIDQAIASVDGTPTVPDTDEYPYTERTQKEYDERIRQLYMGALINIMGAALYIGVCGVTYQLTGQMAEERERGISQLVEAMSPAKKAWHTQFARLLSMHFAFDIIYFPAWVIMGVIVWGLAFPTSSVVILIIFHILAGLSLTSFSIFGAAFFRKAQLSGITIVIIPILLAIIAQVAGPFSTSAVYVLSLLFPSINYVFFIICVARFERQLVAMNMVKAAPAYEDHVWTTPGIVFWVFAIIQTFVYPFLGALVERWLYGTVSADRKTTTSSPDHNIILTNFSKHWTPSWFRRNVLAKFGIKPPETVIAVDDFSMKARKGQIMVLLGANGSGKSTTLDAIAGLNSITTGAIEIDGTGGLGLCPQKNVMWDELNVYEHVRIFNQLKSTGTYDSKDTIEDLIRACDLGHKIKAQSSTLSGGQKRKLQLAMMFTGGSKVCCVDEVSSGLDPLSRRKIWEILLAERGDRTFLLTTHFLDEADVLADYVAILSRGVLKTKGTSVQLKHEVGAGYHVTYPKDAPVKPPMDAIKKPAPSDGMVQYQFANALPATKFVDVLRDHGVKNYDIVGPTLEDVFLANAEEVKEYNLMDAEHVEKDGITAANKDIAASDQNSETEKKLEMGKGHGTGLFKQMIILVQKRITIVKRNFWPYVFALLLPIVAAGLVTLFLKNYEAVGCDPGAAANDPTVFSLSSVNDIPLIPIGPRSIVGPAINTIIQRTGIAEESFFIVDTLDEFNNYVDTQFRNITPGGFFLNQDGPPLMAYLASGSVIGGLITLNTLDNIVLNISISTQYQQFAVPFAPGMGSTLQLILYFGLAMCVYPALFALYPTQERLRNVRALHYSNGIRAVPLWLAYTTFDFFFVLVIAAITTGIFIGASSAWYAPGYLFIVFFLYGLCATLFAYLISIVVTSQLAAFAFAAGGMVSLYLIYFIGYMAILTYAPAYAIDSYIQYFHWTVSIISPSASLLRTQLLSLNSFSVLCNGNQIPSYPGALKVYGGPILYLVVQIIVLFIALVWWDSGYRPAFLNREKSRQQHSEEDVDTIPPAVAAEIARAEQSKDSLRALHLQKKFGSNHAVNDITFGIPQGQVFALLGPNGAGKSSTISLIRGDIHPTTHINGGGDVLIEDISIISKRAAARGHLGVCPQFDAMDSMTVTEHLYFYARARGVPSPKTSVDTILQATSLARFSDRLASKLSGGNKRKLSLGIALMGNPSVLLLDEPSSGMDAAAKRVMWRTLLGVAAPGRALLITTHSMEEADKLATRVGIMKRKMLALGTVSDLGEQYGDAWVVQLVLRSAPETTEQEMQAVKEWVKRRIPGVQLDKWGSRGGGHGQLRFKVLKAAAASSTAPAHEGHMGGKVTEEEVQRVNSVGGSETADMGGIPGLIQLLETHREELGLEYYSVSPTTLDEVFLRVVGEEEEEEAGKKTKKSGGWRKVLPFGKKV